MSAVKPARTTKRGRSSARPTDQYEAPVAPANRPNALAVPFSGRDGRHHVFNFAGFPIAGMRAVVAEAFAVRIGHTGSLHTLSSAVNAWSAIRRFTQFLHGLPRRPQRVESITAQHLRRYRLHRLATMSEVAVYAEMRRICRLLQEVSADGLLAETRAALATGQLSAKPQRRTGVAGYTDEVFDQIMRAARADVAAIRDRLADGERRLAKVSADPDASGTPELMGMATTGEVPMIRHAGFDTPNPRLRKQMASRLFLVCGDSTPLLVLAVGLSGRNGETIKELPVQHQLLDDRAVQLRVTKRRRGNGNWYADVVWEIGPPHRSLHTPGGLYLLILQLTARSRAFSGSNTIWSLWAGGSVKHRLEGGGHADPFAKQLSVGLELSRWARSHGLTEGGRPLRLTLNRLKTTVERRHTRAVGGHLPSAVRTNTQDVLFGSYLAGDPVVRDWADDLIGEAIADAETTARDAHKRALAASGGQLPVVGDEKAQAHTATAFAACTAISDSPFNDGVCRASFLACFACRNAVVSAAHLPALVALQAELERRWHQSASTRWWRRYGQAWLAITEDVLPTFTPAELEAARTPIAVSPAQLLDLLEGPVQL